MVSSLLVLFLSKTSSCCMSSGHSYCHTQRWNGSMLGVITLPAPSLHASVYSIMFGLEVMCWMSVLQSFSVCRSSGVITMKSFVVFSALCTGENNHLPPGTPNDACCILPLSSWYWSFVTVFALHTRLMSLQIFFTMSCNVNFTPVVSHEPSPWANFFCNTGSCPWCPEIAGGGNMECTPKSIAREKRSRFFMVELLVAPIKSSTNTLTRLTYNAAADRRCQAVSLALLNILSSNGSSGRVTSCKGFSDVSGSFRRMMVIHTIPFVNSWGLRFLCHLYQCSGHWMAGHSKSSMRCHR